MPLGANPGRLKTWKPVVDRVKVKLASWKRKFLSLAGRLTLIKAVLSSLSVYYLSLFKMLEGVAKELDKIQAVFLWGGSVIKSKIHIVKWSAVTKSIIKGGLGIKSLRDVNACLLLKWWWRFAGDEKLLWKRVLCGKHNIQGSKWYPTTEATQMHSRVWKDILSVATYTPALHSFYISNTSILVVELRRSLHDWEVCFNRRLRDWEKEEVVRLVNLVNNISELRADKVDALCWRAEKLGCFSVSSVYRWCENSLQPTDFGTISKMIWQSVSTLGAKAFVWNGVLFSEVQPDLFGLCDIIKTGIALWVRAANVKLPFSVNDF
ncbi:uncharacterized protein LOC114317681 [Camellia sinensis]|uniref:uncharacterized protein LOC114317681 n=1 Tax=Camellia sinensis TaxID=4442 RepID=UPI001035E277|nr:uncharacterized protein LOC114317681 [Camellia sinensis]